MIRQGVFRPALPALTALLLAGCAVGPDYHKPAMSFVPFHNQAAVQAVAAGKAAPLDHWWTGFDDPMLVAVVRRALALNLDLAASYARLAQARAAAAAAGAQLLPTVDFDASDTALHQSLTSPLGTLARGLPGYNRDQHEYAIGPAASWEIDLAGGLRRNAAAARDEFEAAAAEQAGTRISVAADAADAYIRIRGNQARLAVAQSQIDTDSKLLDLVRTREKLGLSSEREVAQAEALLQQAQASVPPLRIALEEQLNRLDVLMGAQPGTYAKMLATPAAIPPVPAIGAGNTPLDVLRRRPDIIAAERKLAASNERIGAAISDYYPKISLSGILGFDSISANHLFSQQAFQPSITGAIRWRLFDFGKVDAEVASARGAEAEALADYRQAALKATGDVENAFVTLAQTIRRVSVLENEVASLRRSRDLSEKAYQDGAIPLTDVLDADRQLLAARDDLDANRADAARAAVHTFRALGGGWPVPRPERVAQQSGANS